MTYQLVGCYVDANARDLNGSPVMVSNSMTQLYCFNHCQQLVSEERIGIFLNSVICVASRAYQGHFEGIRAAVIVGFEIGFEV